jgi:hypothetical protein
MGIVHTTATILGKLGGKVDDTSFAAATAAAAAAVRASVGRRGAGYTHEHEDTHDSN